MIEGHGDIASVLPEREDLLFFASGVSNSKETRPEAYRREIELLLDQDKSQHLVYFSSLGVFYAEGRYIDHKKKMEKLVKRYFSTNTIIRIGNITWGDNPNTLINSIRGKIRNRELFEVQDAYRYIIDEEEFLYWVSMIPSWNCEINIPGKRMKVREVIEEYCR